jgi:hypothetical protein
MHPDVLLPRRVSLADGIVQRFVGLEERERLGVDHHQEGVVRVQGVKELVDLQNVLARMVQHAPEPGTRLADPTMNEIKIFGGNQRDGPQYAPSVELFGVDRGPDSEVLGAGGHDFLWAGLGWWAWFVSLRGRRD